MLKLSRLWQGSNIYSLLTAIAVPFTLLTASVSLHSTILTFVIVGIVILYAWRCTLLSQNRDKDRFGSELFIIWLTSSVLSLIIVFQAFVIKLLEILPEENFILQILVAMCFICLYYTKIKADNASQMTKASYSGDIESTSEEKIISGNSSTYCNLCQANNLSRHGHCVWLNCCIGSDNIRFYTFANLFAVLSLLYGSNLTLTTVCHPFIFYNPILLPDDCSEVYVDFNTSISFVCGIYSLIIAIIICLTYFVKIMKKITYIAGIRNDHRSSNLRWNGMMSLFF